MSILDTLRNVTLTPVQIDSFEKLVLHISGMRGSTEYEAIALGEAVELSYYMFRYTEGGAEPERVLDTQVAVSLDEFSDKLKECGADRWNGFHGSHPKGVLDGEMFTLELSVNGGETISADGSANSPKGLSDLRRWMDERLRG